MTRLRIATVSAAAAVVALTAVCARAVPSEDAASGVSGAESAVQARSAFPAGPVLVTAQVGAAAPSASKHADDPANSLSDSKARRLLRDHEASILSFKRAPSDEALCGVLAAADRAQAAVGDSLHGAFEAAMAEGSEGALHRVEALAHDVMVGHPGVGLAVGAETLYHFVDYQALSTQVARTPAIASALTIASRVWPRPAGRPVYFEQITDLAGCMRPSALVEPLRSLRGVWRRLPACMQEHLRTRLTAGAKEIAESTCFCGTQAETEGALKEIASVVERLGGDAEGIRATASAADSSGLRYSCTDPEAPGS